MQGLIHIYTGNGKGKTSAAIGLSLRAAGQGLFVLFVQFLKGGESGEISMLQRIPSITLLRNSKEYGFFNFASPKERQAILLENNTNLQEALRIIEHGGCHILVLDEVFAAYELEAVNRTAIESLVFEKRYDIELVLTGRNAPQAFIDAADYVSEIQQIKHPHDRGIAARKGIEY